MKKGVKNVEAVSEPVAKKPETMFEATLVKLSEGYAKFKKMNEKGKSLSEITLRLDSTLEYTDYIGLLSRKVAFFVGDGKVVRIEKS